LRIAKLIFVLEKLDQVDQVDVMVTAAGHSFVKKEDAGFFMELSALERGIVLQHTTLSSQESTAILTG
jgi:hypothetical protein